MIMWIEALFVHILKASLYGMIIAAVVLALKYILGNRIGARWNYYIWAILLIRLIFPVFLQSSLSLYNYVDVSSTPQVITEQINTLASFPTEQASLSKPVAITSGVVDTSRDNTTIQETQRNRAKINLSAILSLIWIIVSALLLLYSLSCNLYLTHIISKSPVYPASNITTIFDECKKMLRIKKNIGLINCTGFSSPCIYGIIRPKLLISSDLIKKMNDDELRHIILHELMHYKHGDTIINTLVILLRSVYWFNPIFWYCFIQIRKDCELACDEDVLLKLGGSERYAYAQTILNTASYYTKKTLPFPVIGLVDDNKGTSGRISRICKYKKRSILWITAGLLIALLLGIFLLTDKNDIAPKTDISNDISAAFERLIQNTGYMSEHVFELYSDDHSLIISKGSESVDYLFGFIDSIRNSSSSDLVYKKYMAEALISEIFRQNAGDDIINYRKEDVITITNKDALGRTGPGDDYEVWSPISKNSLIRLTGMLDMDWWTAKRVPSSDGAMYTLTDQVEFWIHRDDFETAIIHDDKVGFFQVNTNDAKEYGWIISAPDEKVGLYELPDQKSSVAGYAYSNDLVRVKAYRNKELISAGEWVLIEYIPYDRQNIEAATGWVRSEYIKQRPSDHIANQGFILRNTYIYEKPDHDSSKLEIENLKYFAISCVHILSSSDNWLEISAGADTFTGWVSKDDVHFAITDDIMHTIHNPEPDLDIFILNLKENILNHTSFVIRAEDTGDELVPDQAQRNALSSAITQMGNYQVYDGSINEFREAVYPFYRLDFDDHSLVITTDDSLLLLMDTERAYDYGVGRQGVPVRFITPNIGFIAAIKELMAPSPNNDINDFNFLMNATSISFISGDFTTNNGEGSTKQVHINKVARSIKQSCGKELGSTKPDTESGQEVIIEFGFADGQTIKVTYTDAYIEYNGWYYEPLQPVHHFMGSLFAGYF